MRFYWKSRRLQTHREILFLLIWSFKQEYQILWRWLSDLRPRESSGSSFPTPWLSSARGLRLAGQADQPGRDQAGQSQEGRERGRHGVGARRLHLSQRGGEEQDWDQPLPRPHLIHSVPELLLNCLIRRNDRLWQWSLYHWISTDVRIYFQNKILEIE